MKLAAVKSAFFFKNAKRLENNSFRIESDSTGEMSVLANSC